MLKRLRDKLIRELYKSGIDLEEFVSKYQAKRNSKWADAIEAALDAAETLDGFRGWALSKSAIRAFCINLLNSNSSPTIVELGGGQSTLFWKSFVQKSKLLEINVLTYEHHPVWSREVKKRLGNSDNIEVFNFGLRQVSDSEWATIFMDPVNAMSVWPTIGKPVFDSEYENTRIRNAFYDISVEGFPREGSIDGMIVDGPHGNGRSLAYPLFYNCLKRDAWVLIDDFDHYPFLDDLAQIFKFDLITVSRLFGKRWVLVKLKGTEN